MRGEGSFVFYEDYNFPDFDAPTLHDVRTLLHFSSPEARALAGPPAGLIGAGDDTELDALRAHIPTARLLDIAPTIARILGLDLTASHVEGRVLDEVFTPTSTP